MACYDSEIPVVSICCLTYNHQKFLKETLDSFLMQQTDFAFEVLIHDDASTDGTREIIKEYEQKYPLIFKPIYQTENHWSKGIHNLSATYNFPRAKGKYIAMCEGDDYWTDPYKLQKQIDFLEANDDFTGCFHAATMEYQGRTKRKIIRHKGKSEFSLDYYLKHKIFISTNSMVFRRYVIDGLPSWVPTMFAGDFIFKYMILINGKFKYIDDNMGVYRKGVPGSWSMLPLDQKRVDREYGDQIFALQRINELTNFEYREAVLERTVQLTRAYIGRSIRTTRYNLKLVFKYFPLLGFEGFLIIIKEIIDKVRGTRY